MTRCTFISSYEFFLEREMFQTKLVEKTKTHILRPVTFSENRAVYEIMWKKCGWARETTDGNIGIILAMRWINKVTHTHTRNV
jgi:hypothetical protein